MPYSAVTQPWPLPRSQGGSRSSTLALHSTCVSPNLMRHEPSAWRVKPGIISITRIWSGERPDGRMNAPVFRDTAQRLAVVALGVQQMWRMEERRVGKECDSEDIGGSRSIKKKKELD